MIGSLLAVALAAAGAATVSMPVPPSPAPEPARVERRLVLMGTELTVAVEADDRPAALAASERAVRALEETEARLSTWRADSELSRLNRAGAGERVALSPATAADLAAARSCWAETGGAFDPTVGALAAAWGLRSGGRVPTAAELRAALAATGMDRLDLDLDLGGDRPENPDQGAGGIRFGGGFHGLGGPGGRPLTAARRRAGVRLDEGGFGKGAGLDRAVAALAAPGVRRAWFDLGGQVAGWTAAGGAGAAASAAWTVALADPADRSRPVVALAVDGGSVATSGTSERGRHLLDPRTGRPAPAFGSVTVWTADALRADCLSTGLYVLGPDRALAWAAALPGVEVVVLRRDGGRLAARATAGLAGRLTPLAAEVTVEVVRDRERVKRTARDEGRSLTQRGDDR